jgi:inner membrane protein
MEFAIFFGPWGWVVVGVLLCAVEVFAPGAFLIWLGLAAIATGVLTALVPLTTATSIGYHSYGELARRAPLAGLNRGAQDFVGRELVLVDAIEHGEGRVKAGDTVWRVTGPDLPAGRRVRVVSVEDGVMLRVEAA